MENWKLIRGDYIPTNALTNDDCWQAYENMDAGDYATMTHYANKLVKRVPKLGIKGAVEVVFKLQLFYRLHEVKP